MNKRLPSLLLAGAMVWSLASCTADVPEPLTGTGEGAGYGGPIQVELTLSADKSRIEDIEVTGSSETQGIGGSAIRVLTGSILREQTLRLDSVSGATQSSLGFLSAVREALTAAGAGENSFDSPPSRGAEEQTLTADVVVVGAGGAGMTAAIAAARAGKQVVILEKNAITGGNSARADGGMNAAKTDWQDDNGWGGPAGMDRTLAASQAYSQLRGLSAAVQKEYSLWEAFDSDGCFDSPDLFTLDTMVNGKCANDPDLVATLAENSADAISWLDSIGAPLHGVGFSNGSSVNRLHRPVDERGKVLPLGAYLVPLLEQACIDNGVEIIFNAPVYQILTDNGKAVGVRANGYTVYAKSVVLATGGFGADLELVAQLNPELSGAGTTNAPGITGDGLEMAQAVGADTVDLDRIQLYPTVEPRTSTPIAEELLREGAILVNQAGLRFCDETIGREALSAAELEQPGGYAYLIFDQRMAAASDLLADYIEKGFAVQSSTYAGLAQALDLPQDTFPSAMERWNACVAAGWDGELGRVSLPVSLDTAPFYAIKVVPGVHLTTGGLRINPAAEVQDTSGSSIPGLFAAGEVTGGVHGANCLEGNAITDALVFGRIAGENAAAYAE